MKCDEQDDHSSTYNIIQVAKSKPSHKLDNRVTCFFFSKFCVEVIDTLVKDLFR